MVIPFVWHVSWPFQDVGCVSRLGAVARLCVFLQSNLHWCLHGAFKVNLIDGQLTNPHRFKHYPVRSKQGLCVCSKRSSAVDSWWASSRTKTLQEARVIFTGGRDLGLHESSAVFHWIMIHDDKKSKKRLNLESDCGKWSWFLLFFDR